MMSKNEMHKVFMQLGEYQIAKTTLWCFQSKIIWWVRNCIKKRSSFKFDQIEVASKADNWHNYDWCKKNCNIW